MARRVSSCLALCAAYFSSKLQRMSPTRRPVRAILSEYVGPMPLPVVPTLFLPFDASMAASSTRCVGIMRCAFFDIYRRDFRSWPLFSKSFASSMKRSGANTTPLPMMFTLPPWNIPDGIERSTYFSPLNSSVWPALGPPWKRAITSYLGVRTSTTFPLPSSPHCKPRSTSTFPVIVFYIDFIFIPLYI